ncbi:MAG: Zn-dependent peptidase ImmA (M78 family)/DNA-binding XRE family transcriptional regulator [Phenylobacterium sp.]|jgi:Zn-dependent peptidase ImmA (M78 family)/DNA-binding XRE family transcriptional regulator
MNNLSTENTRKQRLIASRIVFFRKEKEMTQAELSAQVDFNSRQTLSEIEKANRLLQKGELKRIAKALGRPRSDFMDPFLPVEKSYYSWRAVAEDDMKAFENHGDKLITMIDELRQLNEIARSPLMALPVDKNSMPAEVERIAQAFIDKYQLGDNPGANLEYFLENTLGIDCIDLPLASGISGAAIVSHFSNVTFINQNEPKGRRTFNRAHEAFHCLTWKTLPPKHIESHGGKKPYEEVLADVFAASLLMPKQSVIKFAKPEALTSVEHINVLADFFHVSSSALLYRLKFLGLINAQQLNKFLSNPNIIHNGSKPVESDFALYNKKFIELLGSSLDKGLISVRKACDLLDTTIDELKAAFYYHNVEARF